MTDFVFPRHIERLPSTPPPAGPISVGWDLGDPRFDDRPAVTVLESRPEGVLIREALVGDEALAWLRQHVPEALVEGAPNEGHAAFASLEDIPARASIMWATRLPKDEGDYLSGFAHHPQVARLYYYKPVERLLVREIRPGETSEYWAWWDAKGLEFDYVYPMRAGVDMCFPYGAAVETAKGNGEIVNVIVEPA